MTSKYLVVMLVMSSLMTGCGNKTSEKKVPETTEEQTMSSEIEEAIKQYNDAVQSEDLIQTCVNAGYVSGAYLDENDQENYQKWQKTQQEACEKAGIN